MTNELKEVDDKIRCVDCGNEDDFEVVVRGYATYKVSLKTGVWELDDFDSDGSESDDYYCGKCHNERGEKR